MKIILKRFISLVMVGLILMLPGVAFATSNIRVLLDNDYMTFSVDPVLVDGRVLVPLRSIFEQLQTEVYWFGETKTVVAYNESTLITLTIGESLARVNQTTVTLDVPAQIINQRTMVPLRFVAEALGTEVSWLAAERTVLIKSSPATPTPVFEGPLKIGTSIVDLKALMGEPKRIDPSMYGFSWYIYQPKSTDYQMIGLQQGRVVAMYTLSDHMTSKGLVKMGMSATQVQALLGKPVNTITKGNTIYEYARDGQDLFRLEDAFVTVFYDQHQNNTVTGVFSIKKETEVALDGYYGLKNDAIKQAFETQLFDLANVERAQNNLKAFTWAPEVVPVARAHSEDMKNRDYFDHQNPEGLYSYDRLENVSIYGSISGENIAAGQTNAIFAHEGWMNSLGHRQGILSNTTRLGVGVAFGGSYQIYYTQNFYTPY